MLMQELQGRELTPEDYDLLLRLDEALPKRNVLTKSEVAKALAQRQSNDGDEQCSICFTDFDAGEMVAVLSCDHVYHPTCVQSWLTSGRNTCPLCGVKQCCQAAIS